DLPPASGLGGGQRAAEVAVHTLGGGYGNAFERLHRTFRPVVTGDTSKAAIGHRKILSAAPTLVIPAMRGTSEAGASLSVPVQAFAGMTNERDVRETSR